MPKFRKKPVVIEAEHFTSYADAGRLAAWSLSRMRADDNGRIHLVIQTLEGDMRADVGDYIVRGVKGEFYPCKADIFAATYEEVPE